MTWLRKNSTVIVFREFNLFDKIVLLPNPTLPAIYPLKSTNIKWLRTTSISHLYLSCRGNWYGWFRRRLHFVTHRSRGRELTTGARLIDRRVCKIRETVLTQYPRYRHELDATGSSRASSIDRYSLFLSIMMDWFRIPPKESSTTMTIDAQQPAKNSTVQSMSHKRDSRDPSRRFFADFRHYCND